MDQDVRITKLAEGEIDDTRWTFKRAGFLRPHVTARPAGSETDHAVVALGWASGGTVELRNAETLNWSRKFWSGMSSFTTASGRELVVFNPRWGLMRMAADVQVTSAARGVADTSLRLLLGWYLLVLIRQDESSAVVVMS